MAYIWDQSTLAVLQLYENTEHVYHTVFNISEVFNEMQLR